MIHGVSCKDWTIDSLTKGNKFRHVGRISATNPDLLSIISQYEHSGLPFVIEDCHKLPKWSADLSLERFTDFIKQDSILVRNCANGRDLTLPLNTFIERSRKIETNAVPGETERLYGKDAPCPPEWYEWLTSSGVVPSSLLPDSADNLLLNIPQSQRVETLMCYLGVGDTYTSMHKDLCASSGQNLMCYTENGGSSFWFMTESSAAQAMSDYFHELQQELDHETHVITLDQLALAPCTVYITQQRLGDLVFVPPRSCHQVVNSGGITIKTSWSRMTLQGLKTALYHELPIYRRVCRPEIYRVRSTIYHTLKLFTSKLKSIPPSNAADTHVSQLGTTLELFDHILVEEYSKDSERMPCVVSSHSDGSESLVSCDFCGADIFQSFFECRTCSESSQSRVGDGYAICAGCYIEGRSCLCARMEPVQYRRFGDLLTHRKEAVDVLTSHLEASGTTMELKAEEQLLCDNYYTMIFTAGCTLREMREKRLSTEQKAVSSKGDWRICNVSERHNVLVDSWKFCKKCHKAACYAHSLKSRKIHSLEVMLTSGQDENDEIYHSVHMRTGERYDQGSDKFRQAQAAGDVPDFLVQLVNLATSFKICKPINSEFMTLGWYDKLKGIENQRVAEPLNTEPTSEPEPVSPEVSSDTLALSTVPPEVSEEVSVEVSPQLSVSISSRKRKRLLYVDMPPIPAEYRSAPVKHHHTQAAGALPQSISELSTQVVERPKSVSLTTTLHSSTQALSTLSSMKTKQVVDHVLMPPVPTKYRRNSLLPPKELRTKQSVKTKHNHIASTALPARQAQFDPKTRTVVTIAEKRPDSTLSKGYERGKKRRRLSHSQTLSKAAELSSPQSLPPDLRLRNGTPSTPDEGAAGLVAAYTSRQGSTFSKGEERGKKKRRLSHSQTLSKAAEPPPSQFPPPDLSFKKNGSPPTADEGTAGPVAAYTPRPGSPFSKGEERGKKKRRLSQMLSKATELSSPQSLPQDLRFKKNRTPPTADEAAYTSRPGSTFSKGEERGKKKRPLSHSRTLGQAAEVSFPQPLPSGLRFKKNGPPSTTDEGAAGLAAAYKSAFSPTSSLPAGSGVSHLPLSMHPLTNETISPVENPSLSSEPYPDDPPASAQTHHFYEVQIHCLNRQVEELKKELKEEREQRLRQPGKDQQALRARPRFQTSTEPHNHRRIHEFTDPAPYEHQSQHMHIHYHIHEPRNMKSRTPRPSNPIRLVDRIAPLSLAERIGDIATTTPSDDEDNEPDGRETSVQEDGRNAKLEQMSKFEPSSASAKPMDQSGDGNHGLNKRDREPTEPIEFDRSKETHAAFGEKDRNRGSSKHYGVSNGPIESYRPDEADSNHGSSEHDGELINRVEFDNASRGSSPVSMDSDSEEA